MEKKGENTMIKKEVIKVGLSFTLMCKDYGIEPRMHVLMAPTRVDCEVCGKSVKKGELLAINWNWICLHLLCADCTEAFGVL